MEREEMCLCLSIVLDRLCLVIVDMERMASRAMTRRQRQTATLRIRLINTDVLTGRPRLWRLLVNILRTVPLMSIFWYINFLIRTVIIMMRMVFCCGVYINVYCKTEAWNWGTILLSTSRLPQVFDGCMVWSTMTPAKYLTIYSTAKTKSDRQIADKV